MDLTGEKSIIKLWETLVEKGIGSLLSPWYIKREGRARIEVRREELLTMLKSSRIWPIFGPAVSASTSLVLSA